MLLHFCLYFFPLYWLHVLVIVAYYESMLSLSIPVFCDQITKSANLFSIYLYYPIFNKSGCLDNLIMLKMYFFHLMKYCFWHDLILINFLSSFDENFYYLYIFNCDSFMWFISLNLCFCPSDFLTYFVREQVSLFVCLFWYFEASSGLFLLVFITSFHWDASF